LPNGVPIVPSRPQVRSSIRARLGWGHSEIGIGYVSRMAAHKGHKDLIEAFALARDLGLPLKGCLLGDGPERPRIEQDIRRLKLEDRIHLAGIVDNVDEYIKAFAVVAPVSPW